MLRQQLTTVKFLCALLAVAQFPAPSLAAVVPGFEIANGLSSKALEIVGEYFVPASSDKFRNNNYYYYQNDVAQQQQQPADPDTHRNIVELIESRGFEAEQHDVTTKDGYIISIQRIVNPLIAIDYKPKMKPVIMQHGLFSSAADWVINSVNVKPSEYPRESDGVKETNLTQIITNNVSSNKNENKEKNQTFIGGDSQEHPNSLGFYLANEGYDVWLSTIRGNKYAERHLKLSPWSPKFWAFSFDEHIAYDLPAVIGYVQNMTGHTKVGYVGHSQGTLMGFGLLADYPEYADIIEPFIALAPVAYVDNAISPAKYFAVYTPLAQHMDMWFMTSNIAVKYLTPIVCGPHVVRRDICSNLLFLTTGFDMDELDIDRLSAYINHTPAGTSVKNIAHYGQEIFSHRFAHFDHGVAGNLIKYGSIKNPDYNLAKIRSKSIALFTAENDWLAAPKDVARLKAALKVKPHYVFNATEVKPKWNHIDFVYGKSCGQVVNTRVLKVMNDFRKK